MTDYDHPHFQQYIRHFNQASFFVSHEDMEQIWVEHGRVKKDIYHGLTQLAVALEHLKRGNLKSANNVFIRAQSKLVNFPVCVLNLADVLEKTQMCIEEKKTDGPFPKFSIEVPSVP